MSEVVRLGRAAVRAINSIVNFIVLVIVLLIVAFASYALWDSEQIYGAASADKYEVYQPRIEDEGESFDELRAINPEVFSWLTVYGTNINYPVAQADNNWKYVNTNAEGDYSLAGSIFLDYANANDYSDFNSIFYGHHMARQTMFGEIGNFSQREYFDGRLYGNLYYEGRDHGLEFFAFMHVDAYDASVFTAAIAGEDNHQIYLDNLLELSMHVRDIGVTIDDRLVLLTTCSTSSTNGRDILVGRITDLTFEDPFAVEETEDTVARIFSTVDRQVGYSWSSVRGWLFAGLAVLIVLISLVLIFYKKRPKSKGKYAAK